MKFTAVSLGLFSFATSFAPSAYALDLGGGQTIKITNLVQNYTSREISGPMAPSTNQTPPENTEINLSVYQDGALISWYPSLSPPCETRDGFTSVTVLYDTKGSRTGKINCSPSDHSTSSRSSIIITNGSYSSKLRKTGDVIELAGQMTYTEKWTSQGGVSGGAAGSNTTTKIQQSARIRVVGGQCEVIRLSETAYRVSNRRGNPSDGHNWNAQSDTRKQIDASSSTRCEIR